MYIHIRTHVTMFKLNTIYKEKKKNKLNFLYINVNKSVYNILCFDWPPISLLLLYF